MWIGESSGSGHHTVGLCTTIGISANRMILVCATVLAYQSLIDQVPAGSEKLSTRANKSLIKYKCYN